ncbi:hypothetical protein AAHA92_29426 [Salvia divinorum]|uniref:Uncharacterized protein n=1 Tax=Salvia divinorum TaxID=28513 RepID=A0ABD1G0Y3_SALDI
MKSDAISNGFLAKVIYILTPTTHPSQISHTLLPLSPPPLSMPPIPPVRRRFPSPLRRWFPSPLRRLPFSIMRT